LLILIELTLLDEPTSLWSYSGTEPTDYWVINARKR